MIFSLLAFRASACNVSPDFGLVLLNPSSLSAIENGSECDPFKTLDSAILSISISGGTVKSASKNQVLSLSSTTISQTILILAEGAQISLEGTIAISGSLIISNAILKSDIIPNTEGFNVLGSLTLKSVSVEGFMSSVLNLQGSFEATDSKFIGNFDYIISSTTFGISVLANKSTVDGNVGFLQWTPSQNDFASKIEIDDCIISSCLGPCLVLTVPSATISQHIIEITNSEFNSNSIGLVLTLRSTSATITNCIFSHTIGSALIIYAFDLPVFLSNNQFVGTSSVSILVPKVSNFVKPN